MTLGKGFVAGMLLVAAAGLAGAAHADLAPKRASNLVAIATSLTSSTICGSSGKEVFLGDFSVPEGQVLIMTDFSWNGTAAPGAEVEVIVAPEGDVGLPEGIATSAAAAGSDGHAFNTQLIPVGVRALEASPGRTHLCVIAARAGTSVSGNFTLHGFLARDR